MTRYLNLGRDSGVRSYSYDSTSITVQFDDGMTYVYTDSRAGTRHIEQMKRMADLGQGLNAYINQNVRKLYSSKY